MKIRRSTIFMFLVIALIMCFSFTVFAKVKLIYWGYPIIPLEGKEVGWYDKERIKAFEELYPEVEVEVEIIPWDKGSQKIAMAIAAGNAPDILQSSQMGGMSYAVAGVTQPFDFENILTPEIKNDFYPFALDLATYKGEVHFYPTAAAVSGLAVNQNIVEQADAMHLLPLHRPGRTWSLEEYKTFLTKISMAKIPNVWPALYYFADSDSQQHQVMQFCQSFGAPPPFILEEDGKWKCVINDPRAVEGIEWYMENIYRAGLAVPGAESIGENQCSDFYRPGIGASWAGSNWAHRRVEDSRPSILSKSIFFPFPTKEGVYPVGCVGFSGLTIFDNNQDTEKLKYAQLLCEFWNTGRYLELRGMAPVRKSMAISFPEDAHPEFVFCMTELVKYAEDKGSMCPVYQQFRHAWASYMQGVVMDMLTPQEALDGLAEEMNKLLDEFYEEESR